MRGLNVIVTLALCGNAYAFEHIETDAAYDRIIRPQIMTEFSQGLKLLKSQADSLKMNVREKDIEALKNHMYEKALLMGDCLDKATTQTKIGTSRIDVKAFAKKCVDLHVKFIGWYKQAPKKPLAIEICIHDLQGRAFEEPFDFLGIDIARVKMMKAGLGGAPNWIGIRDCYEQQPEFVKEDMSRRTGYPKDP